MTISWKYAYASTAGTYHKKRGTACQDCCIVKTIHTDCGELLLVITASDGAGSVKHSEIGSRLACSLLMEEIKEFFSSGRDISGLTRPVAEEMIMRFQEEVLKYAAAIGAEAHDFSCTMLSAVVGIDRAAFFQIGDGAIVVSTRKEPGNYFPVFWPLKGEYENTTYFAVDGESSLRYMKYRLIESTVDEVAVFTDGLQHLTLHYRSKSAHSMFFKPLFQHLRLQPIASENRFIDSLVSFLNSKKVNERTDDDKTLIIASRCDG